MEDRLLRAEERLTSLEALAKKLMDGHQQIQKALEMDERDEIVGLTSIDRIRDLKAKLALADGVAAALRVYLMAGSKDARRDASILAKSALAAYEKGSVT